MLYPLSYRSREGNLIVLFSNNQSRITCYVALGGNVGNTFSLFCRALYILAASKEVLGIITSRLYKTSPVSPIPQRDYLNAVCRFETELSVLDLFSLLQKIEKKLGKHPKPRDYPRPLDLDLLFYGSMHYHSPHLTIPHPRWEERLFVLVPLADVAKKSFLIDVKNKISHLCSRTNDKVELAGQKLPWQREEYAKNCC